MAKENRSDMQSALRYFLTRHPALTGLFAVAMLALFFFAAKFLLHLGQFHDRPAPYQPLEAWMRPRFVAMSYELPPEALAEILGVAPPQMRRGRAAPTMGEIAEERGVSLEALTEQLRAGAAEFHGGRGQ